MVADEEMPDANGEPDQVQDVLPPPAMLPPPSGPPAGDCTAKHEQMAFYTMQS